MNTGATSLLNILKADNLLENSYIFEEIKDLLNNLYVSSEGNHITFEEFYAGIERELKDIPRLELNASIAPGTEAQYTISLGVAMERVNNESSRLKRRILAFQGRMKNALSRAKSIEASFVAWYTLAANEVLSNYQGMKLPATSIKALAESEFSRLLKGVTLDLEFLVESSKVQITQIDIHQKSQQEKYNHGKDQANASWTGNLPDFGVTSDPRAQSQVASGMDEETEEAEVEVPAFVSKKADRKSVPTPHTPQIIAFNPIAEVNTVSDGYVKTTEFATVQTTPSVPQVEVTGVVGTFKKTGTAQPAVILSPEEAEEILDETLEVTELMAIVQPEVTEAPKATTSKPRKRLLLDFQDEDVL